MDNKKSQTKKQTIIYRIIFVVLLAVVVVCAVYLITYYVKKNSANKKMDELTKLTNAKNTEQGQEPVKAETQVESAGNILEERGIQIPEKNFDWESIKQENPDIYAWIYIPGTKVDYPVLQHPTDDSYYLNHNLDGSTGYPGCIYTEMLNVKDFSDHNTILYGHNMKDGSMFHTLHDFANKDFFDKTQYGYVYMPDGNVYVYDLFGAYTYTDEHILKTYGLKTEEEFSNYVEMLYNSADGNFREGVNVTGNRHIITMSTCIGNAPNNRYIVAGVLINDPTLDYAEQKALYND